MYLTRYKKAVFFGYSFLNLYYIFVGFIKLGFVINQYIPPNSIIKIIAMIIILPIKPKLKPPVAKSANGTAKPITTYL